MPDRETLAQQIRELTRPIGQVSGYDSILRHSQHAHHQSQQRSVSRAHQERRIPASAVLTAALGRPLVDRIAGSDLHNLKELRPGSSGGSEVRILFTFDPVRNAVLLVAGDKSGRWKEVEGVVRRGHPGGGSAYKAYLEGQR